MRAMVEMSRAIREVIQLHGKTLRDLDQETLNDFTQIVAAFNADLHAEQSRRVDLARRDSA